MLGWLFPRAGERERTGHRLRQREVRWPQRLRCLVLAQGQTLVAIFNADWGRWLKLVDEVRALAAEAGVLAVPGRQVAVLCFPTHANHNIDFEGFYWGARPREPAVRRGSPHAAAGRAAGRIVASAGSNATGDSRGRDGDVRLAGGSSRKQ